MKVELNKELNDKTYHLCQYCHTQKEAILAVTQLNSKEIEAFFESINNEYLIYAAYKIVK